VLDLLGQLVDKSLVVARASMGGAVRYRMLELIRQYAREKLEVSAEADEVKGLHAAFFLALAEEAKTELSGAQQKLWVERLEEEHDNLRGALSWVLERGEGDLGLRFGGALWRFWFVQGYVSEGVRWLELALAGSGPAVAPPRVEALEGMGWLMQAQGDLERAEATYEEMLKLSRELDDKENVATALNSLGALALVRGDNERARVLLEENMAVVQELDERSTATILKRFHVVILLGGLAMNEEGDYARAQALWEESLKLAREAGDTLRIGLSLTFLQHAALVQGDHERATALCEEALALAREKNTGEGAFVPGTFINLGVASLGLGDHERARASFEEALILSRKLGKKPTLIDALEGMASLAAALGEATRAAHLWGAAEAAREVTDMALPPADRTLHEPYLPAARSQLGEAAWEEALAVGREMSLEEATDYALAKEEEAAAPTFPAPPDEPSADQPPVALSPREKEVAVLVTQDMTNRQIASELTLSEHTVATHVRNVLKKLGLHSRNQIAAWFREHQPLP